MLEDDNGFQKFACYHLLSVWRRKKLFCSIFFLLPVIFCFVFFALLFFWRFFLLSINLSLQRLWTGLPSRLVNSESTEIGLPQQEQTGNWPLEKKLSTSISDDFAGPFVPEGPEKTYSSFSLASILRVQQLDPFGTTGTELKLAWPSSSWLNFKPWKTRSLFFERRYTICELLDWLHAKVKWTEGPIVRHRNPLEIIDFGKGRCGEFSILFTTLCLIHNYRARLILDMSDHVWTEVWDNNQHRWIHVDPSEKKIDDPMMYERDWKKNLTRVYALENGNAENVTKNYKLPSTT